MIESYKNMARSNADKKAIKDKLSELRQAIKDLENNL